MRSAVDIQEPSCKDCRDADFSFRGHLQAPDLDDGKEQDGKVRYHIDGTTGDKDILVVDAMAWFCRVPQFASRHARPDLDGQVGEIEEEVEQYYPLDYPVCSSPTVRNEYP